MNLQSPLPGIPGPAPASGWARRSPTKEELTPTGTHTCCHCCSQMVQSQYSGGRQLLGAQRERSGRAGLLYPLLDPRASPVPQRSPCPSGKSLACTKSGFRTSKHIYISANSTTRLTCRPEGNQLTEQPWIWTAGPEPHHPLHQDGFTLRGGGTYSKSSRDRGQPRGRWEAQKSCTNWRLYRLSATDMGSLRHTSVGTGYMGLQLNRKEDGSSREAFL